MWLTAAQLRRFAPSAKPDIVAAFVNGASKLDDAGLMTPLRMAHFLAQLATETGGFTIYEENMNYSAKRLTQVWPSHFRTMDDATPYARNPEKLANYIYADKNRSRGYRLGNVNDGDGWKYRGRGLIQTTGRENYRKIGYEENPNALNDPANGLVAAISEWTYTGCNVLADADNVEAVRRKINGGLIGIEDCRFWLQKAKEIFVETEERPPVLPEPAIPPPRPRPMPPDYEPPTSPPFGGLFDALVAFIRSLFKR